MELSGGDLNNVIRTTMPEAGENATPASMAVASVIRNRLAAGVTANRLPRSSTPPTNLSRGTKGQDVIQAKAIRTSLALTINLCHTRTFSASSSAAGRQHDVCKMGKRNGQRPLTNVERQAKWRASHARELAASDAVSGKRALMVTCIPRVPLNLDEIERSAGATLALHNKLVSIVATWLDGVDVTMLSPAEVFLALRLLGPTLESLAILHAKISEQRGVETIAAMRANVGELGMNARDVTSPAPRPKIEETLELLRSRFEDNIKPKTN